MNRKCYTCHKEFDESELTHTHGSIYYCKRCFVRYLEAQRRLVDYWLKFKTTSEHGKKLNAKILADIDRELEYARKQIYIR